jgi:hypothetical protein
MSKLGGCRIELSVGGLLPADAAAKWVERGLRHGRPNAMDEIERRDTGRVTAPARSDTSGLMLGFLGIAIFGATLCQSPISPSRERRQMLHYR